MEHLEQPELKWNGHGQSGDSNSSFDGNGTSSSVTSPGSGSSELKNRAGSGFQFTQGFGAIESHIEGHVDAGETNLNNSSSVYFDRDQGTDSANGFSEIKSNVIESLPIEANFELGELNATYIDLSVEKNSATAIEYRVGELLKVESFSDPSLLTVGKVHEEESTNVNNLNNGDGAGEIVDFIEEECDLDVPDLDVEGVIAKQETHDLFCPNCHSCITKKVILRRRKLIRRRKGRIHKPAKEVRPQLDAKSEHLEVEDDQGEHRVDSGSNDGPTPVINDNDQDREKEDVFRCLSCFSFFIPQGNGLFRIFRGKNDTETVQNPRDIPAPAANTNSLFSLFGSNKRKIAAVEQDAVIKGNPSLTSDDTTLSGLVIEQPAVSLSISTLGVRGQPTEAFKAPQDGLNGEVHSVGEFLLNGKSDIKVDQLTDMAMKYKILPDQNGLASYNQPIYRIEVENDGANEPQKVGIDTCTFVVQECKQPERVIAYVPETLLDLVPPNKTGSTPSITVAERGSDPEIAENIVGSRDETSLQTDTRIDVDEPIAAQPSEPSEWDILKSIVYGGLIESITSLGVVSSAAGAGATTLNIMVLAVANLFGGFFIIAHNLVELKNDLSGETSTETAEPQGRHYELLGRPEKFKLHAVVAILSFLIFGALPPIIYGFSFRQSDDRDYKLAVVAASSLLCIALLATGKSHVQKPPKSYFKTILYYVTIGFMASGVSYLVGVLLEKLVKDLGLYDSSFVSNVRIGGAGSEQQQQVGWASY